MDRSTVSHAHFEWLMDSNIEGFVLEHGEDHESVAYPLPSDIGQGHFKKYFLPMGMTFMYAWHEFSSMQPGHLVPLMRATVHFTEQTFMVQSVRGGIIVHEERIPLMRHQCQPGLDIFRSCEAVDLTPFLDCGSNSQIASLSIGVLNLQQLMGETEAGAMLEVLGVPSSPTIALKSIPISLSDPLHQALPEIYSGQIGKLFCQSKCLEYLTNLYHYLVPKYADVISAKRDTVASEIFRHLSKLEGKLPTLESLSKEFGYSARQLNQIFREVYGQSIYAFVVDQRLLDAHLTIANSNVPLKVISARLGYSHVNHFNAAFKKKFGYPPGKIRKEFTNAQNKDSG